MATIAILQRRTLERSHPEKAQLQAALHSRILVEQAKGLLAERWRTEPDNAFDTLRVYARDRGLRLIDLARDVVEGTADTEAMRDH